MELVKQEFASQATELKRLWSNKREVRAQERRAHGRAPRDVGGARARPRHVRSSCRKA
jgi:hypothetical protein